MRAQASHHPTWRYSQYPGPWKTVHIFLTHCDPLSHWYSQPPTVQPPSVHPHVRTYSHVRTHTHTSRLTRSASPPPSRRCKPPSPLSMNEWSHGLHGVHCRHPPYAHVGRCVHDRWPLKTIQSDHENSAQLWAPYGLWPASQVSRPGAVQAARAYQTKTTSTAPFLK